MTISLFLTDSSAYAQQFPETPTFFTIDKQGLNPALAGYSGNTVLNADIVQKWVTLSGSPTLFNFNISGPIHKNLAGAFNIGRFSSGNFVSYSASGSLGSSVKTGANSNLYFALSTKYIYSAYNQAGIKSNFVDPILIQLGSLKGNHWQAGAGIAWSYSNIILGVFSEQLISNDFGSGVSSSKAIPIGFHSSYLFELNKNSRLRIGGLVKGYPKDLNEGVNYAASTVWDWKKNIFAGLTYNSDLSLAVLCGTALTEKINLFYSYRIGFAPTNTFSAGSHFLKFAVLLKRKKADNLFPISDKERKLLNKNKTEEAYREEIEELKKHFNKTIYEYEKRLKELEEKNK
ncbi:MAG: type IX secretion system membrane protein PorP/SprF [Bacteroidota bacterium]|nr:type IX secretion system membrane protein PorP/SprF [Bacteroidota bacterium]